MSNDSEREKECAALHAESLKEKLKEWGNQLDPQQKVLLDYILSFGDHSMAPRDFNAAVILYDKAFKGAVISALRSAVSKEEIERVDKEVQAQKDVSYPRQGPWILNIE